MEMLTAKEAREIAGEPEDIVGQVMENIELAEKKGNSCIEIDFDSMSIPLKDDVFYEIRKLGYSIEIRRGLFIVYL